MDPLIALIIYLIAVLITFFLAKNAGIQTWSAFILALVVGAILLAILAPFSIADTFAAGPVQAVSSTLLYLFVGVITTILILIYVIQKALQDRV